MNLIDHHRAAHALMQELLTPESSNANELHTNIFLWYARFDVVVGILAGTETVLSRDWYMAKEQYDAEQAALYSKSYPFCSIKAILRRDHIWCLWSFGRNMLAIPMLFLNMMQ